MFKTPAVSISLWLMLSGIALAGQNIVVVLDDSGSMASRMRANRRVRRIQAAKDALNVVLEKLPADARIGVLPLNSGTRRDPWIIRLGPLDKQQLSQAVGRVRANGGTPLGLFMKVGTDELLKLRADQHYGTYRLLIVTDGEANDPENVQRYLPEIMARGITVDVIGVDMRQQHSLATQVHSYRRADDAASLTKAISEALAESGDQRDDAGQSDFELLAEFPDELAVAALEALGATDNQPLSGVEALDGQPSSGFSPRPGLSIFGLGLGLFCMASVFILIATGFVMLKAAVRRI